MRVSPTNEQARQEPAKVRDSEACDIRHKLLGGDVPQDAARTLLRLTREYAGKV